MAVEKNNLQFYDEDTTEAIQKSRQLNPKALDQILEKCVSINTEDFVLLYHISSLRSFRQLNAAPGLKKANSSSFKKNLHVKLKSFLRSLF